MLKIKLVGLCLLMSIVLFAQNLDEKKQQLDKLNKKIEEENKLIEEVERKTQKKILVPQNPKKIKLRRR